MRSGLLLTLVLFGLILDGRCEEESGEIDQIISGYCVPNNRVYPYMVYVTTKNRLRQDQFLCSRTLAAPRKLLTAASCFEWMGPNSFPLGIFTPVAWLNTEILGGPYTIRRQVTQVNKHPHYNPANGGNHDNIAIVTLDTEVLLSSVNPVKLGLYQDYQFDSNKGYYKYDVGSPILFRDTGQQTGVIGKNMRCGGSDEPIVAVDVHRMASFIRQYV